MVLFNKKVTPERESMKVLTNASQAQKDIAITYGSYKPIGEGIAKLKTITKAVPWDNLYDALGTGDLRTAMAKHWAASNAMDWDDVNVRNETRAKFSFLSGCTPFPKEYVIRHIDGSFDISMEAIRESYRRLYERTIEPDQVEMVEQLCEIINKLKLNIYQFHTYVGLTPSGEASPCWEELAKVIGNR